MRVMLADDSALFRIGLQRLLTDLGVDVVAVFDNGGSLIERVEEEPPDVAILDIRMPPTFTDEGLQTATLLRSRYPDVAVLLLSTYAESGSAARLLAAGTEKVGYLLKDRVDDPRTLRDVLFRLTRGECVIDHELISALVAARHRAKEIGRLTERERAVLQLMAEGHSNEGISRECYLSAKTVETHISSIFSKLDLPVETRQNRRVLAVLTWLRHRDEFTITN